MAFNISGLVAGGMQDALDEVMERRLREQMRRQQEQQQAAQLALQQRQQQGVEDDRTYRRDNDRRVIDLEEMERIDAKALQATDRNISLDAANVMNMPGMTPQARADELNQSLFRNPKASSAPDMRKVIEGLTKRPDRVQYTYTNPKTGNQATRFGNPDEMPAGGFDMGNEPKVPTKGPEPEWLMRGGKPIKGYYQPGDLKYEPTAKSEAAENKKAEAEDTAREAKRLAQALLDSAGFSGAFGLANSRMPTVSQETADAEEIRESLTALLTMENMDKMTGILSDSDMKVLRKASSTIAARMSPAAARAELIRVTQIMGGAPRPRGVINYNDEIARLRARTRPQ